MSGNPGKNVSIRFKAEVTPGTPVTGGSGEELRWHPGSGLSMSRKLIEDPTVRPDGQEEMPRLGSKSVNGIYPATLSLGAFNTLIAGLFRNTFVASATIITCDNGATYTSLAVTLTNTLTLVGSGSFLSLGVRVGDVIRLGATAANNDINAVVATVAANVITVLGAPWTNFTADNNATLDLKKKIKNSTTLTRAAFTFEEYSEDLDESEQFTLCRVSSMKLSWEPNSVVKVEFGIVGQKGAILGTAAAPGLTSPTQYTAIGLVAADALIYLAGSQIAVMTKGELMFDLGAEGIDVVGSPDTPDVYEGSMHVTGNISAVRTALTASNLARFIAETDNVELSVMFVEPDAAVPIDFFHVFLPRIKYMGVTKNLGNQGPIVEDIPIRAAARVAATGYDAMTASISTSV